MFPVEHLSPIFFGKSFSSPRTRSKNVIKYMVFAPKQPIFDRYWSEEFFGRRAAQVHKNIAQTSLFHAYFAALSQALPLKSNNKPRAWKQSAIMYFIWLHVILIKFIWLQMYFALFHVKPCRYILIERPFLRVCQAWIWLLWYTLDVSHETYV